VSRILLIEDERDLALGICANLEVEGYEVTVAYTGEEGLEQARTCNPDLIILDLMLPGMSGYDVLASVRATDPTTPVLILSARGEEVDKVRGFRGGADDYLVKPFGVMELIVRIESLLRRRAPSATVSDSTFQIGEVRVDPDRHAVIRDGVELPLTPKALDLLRALVKRANRVVTRQELLRDVWGYSADVTTRTVDAHVAELRRKLERNPGKPRHLLTVWRVGYRLKL
jgi:DNA-binding response OmpR family regulator